MAENVSFARTAKRFTLPEQPKWLGRRQSSKKSDTANMPKIARVVRMARNAKLAKIVISANVAKLKRRPKRPKYLNWLKISKTPMLLEGPDQQK